MVPPAIATGLFLRFNDRKEAHRSAGWNHPELREEFLNPLFEVLGWDVYNREGCAEAKKPSAGDLLPSAALLKWW